MARYAAKVYARERSMVPNRAAAMVFDGTRYALRTGKWSWTGMSVEEIWLKYEREVKEELLSAAAGAAAIADGTDLSSAPAPGDKAGPNSSSRVPPAVVIDEEELYRRLYQRIIYKSCSTNPMIDRIAAPKGMNNAAARDVREAYLGACTSSQAAGEGAGLSEDEYRRRLGEVLATARFKATVARWVDALDAALIEALNLPWAEKKPQEKKKRRNDIP